MEAAESPEASAHFTTRHNVTFQKIFILDLISATFTNYLAPVYWQIHLCVHKYTHTHRHFTSHQYETSKRNINMSFTFTHQVGRYASPPWRCPGPVKCCLNVPLHWAPPFGGPVKDCLYFKLCSTSLVCEFLHFSTCSNGSRHRTGRAPRFTFQSKLEMS